MAITKRKRGKVRAKADNCWYCGDPLLDHGWDIDHVIPKNNYSKERGCLIVDGKEFREYGLNNIKNLVPCCRRCNLWKGSSTVEEFRASIEAQPEVMQAKSAGYRIAVKFGLIYVLPKAVVFWFEKYNR